MATSGTLGESSCMYLGMAVANDIQKTGDITVYCQGDGASNRAPTHEAMATAAAWQLPVVFVIVNNQYGMGTSVKKAYNIQGNRMTLTRVKHLCEVAVVPSRLQALALYSSLAARLVSQ